MRGLAPAGLSGRRPGHGWLTWAAAGEGQPASPSRDRGRRPLPALKRPEALQGPFNGLLVPFLVSVARRECSNLSVSESDKTEERV